MAVYSIISDNVSLTVTLRCLSKIGIKIMNYTIIRFINSPKIACGLFDSEITGMPISSIFHVEDMETRVSGAELF